MWILWLAVAAALATFVVETAFIYLMTAKRLIDRPGGLPFDMKMIAYFWLALGYPADVAFNWTRGTWMMRELPPIVWHDVGPFRLPFPEALFSTRVQRLVLSDRSRVSTRQWQTAHYWAHLLNDIDPGHIRFKGQ